jgi:threonine dehydrogenase-like Zn-dependent dehydrogenase
MKSRGLWGKKFLDIQERTLDIGNPDDDHVIVKVRACGVCGADINFARDWDTDPMPLGHEIAAEVVEVGKNVTSVKPGHRVIVEDCTMWNLQGLQERPATIVPQHVQHCGGTARYDPGPYGPRRRVNSVSSSQVTLLLNTSFSIASANP